MAMAPGDGMNAAHHLRDGSFRNPWPQSDLHGVRDVVRFMKDHYVAIRRNGGRPSPHRTAPEIAHPRADVRDFRATWIGHSTVLLQAGGLNVLTDPVFARRASPVQWLGPRRLVDAALDITALPPIDVVLISHNHYDHLDRAAVRHLATAYPAASWIVPLGLGASIRRWGARDVIELDWWQTVDVKGLAVTATPAQHFSGRGLHDRNRTLWCGFALSIGGWRGYFAGDTAYHDGFGEIGARCGPFDFVMLPIGAYEPRWFMRVVHIDPEEAVQVYRDLVSPHADSPLPLMLGIHWGTYRLTLEPVDEPPMRVAAHWQRVGLDPDRLWLARFGETRAVVNTA
jgi:N-acyl-phosphatidylethanolamine-hydrolysing phospholipase D